MASNLMRSIEREFDHARRMFGRNLISLPDPTSLFRIGELPSTSQSNELVQLDNEGNRKLHIDFDMSGFQPEEIKVRTQNHNLIISAKKEKKVSFSFLIRLSYFVTFFYSDFLDKHRLLFERVQPIVSVAQRLET